MRAARWSDNDRYFGPFTWASDGSWKHYAVVLCSAGDGDSHGDQCTLRFTFRHTTLIVALPHIIKPWREKVYPNWDVATVERLGRDWYWNIDQREYGVSLSDGHLTVYYGRRGGSCMDSRIQQQWGCFLPWTRWRHVRHSLYGLAGEHFWTDPQTGKSTELGALGPWEAYRAAKDACPTVAFNYADFDGEELVATTQIEEREWRFGTGWFKWLSWFRRPRVRRSLNIEFSKETGPEKGSWKGGVCGTGIEMLQGELHEAAFRRYCDDEHRSKYRKYRVTFLGPAAALNPHKPEGGA
jgi:hypothetical protein